MFKIVLATSKESKVLQVNVSGCKNQLYGPLANWRECTNFATHSIEYQCFGSDGTTEYKRQREVRLGQSTS